MSDFITPSKLVSERFTLYFNFLDELEWNESIEAASCVVSVHSGVDPSPQEILYRTAIVGESGTQVTQQVYLGLPGVIYKVACYSTGSTGNSYTRWTYLAILPDNARSPPPFGTMVTSRPYPIEDLAHIQFFSEVDDGRLADLLVREDEACTFGLSVAEGTLIGGLQSFDFEEEWLSFGLTPIGGDLYGGEEDYSMLPEWSQFTVLLQNGTLIGARVAYDIPPEWAQFSLTLQNGTLVT